MRVAAIALGLALIPRCVSAQPHTSSPLTTTESTNLEKHQTPLRPYPYKHDVVSFKNAKSNLTMSGILTIPNGSGKVPAVVLIMGDCHRDNDAPPNSHLYSLVLADCLTRRGVAVLRFDKRGCGRTPGVFGDSTISDFAEDTVAAVEYLKRRSDIDLSSIGVIGHSHGASEAALASVKSRVIEFVVLMGAPGVRGDDLHIKQLAWMRSDHKLPAEAEERAAKALAKIIALVKSDDRYAVAEKDIDAIWAEFGFRPPANAREYLTKQKRFLFHYDPVVTLSKVKRPVLIVHGEKDIYVPASENLPLLIRGLEEAKNSQVVVKRIADVNHFFQSCKNGTTDEASQLNETLSVPAMEMIAQWITTEVAPRRP